MLGLNAWIDACYCSTEAVDGVPAALAKDTLTKESPHVTS